VTPCIVAVGYQRFRSPCCLHFRGKATRSQSQSNFTTDGHSLSPSRRRVPSRAHDQNLVLVKTCDFASLSCNRSVFVYVSSDICIIHFNLFLFYIYFIFFNFLVFYIQMSMQTLGPSVQALYSRLCLIPIYDQEA